MPGTKLTYVVSSGGEAFRLPSIAAASQAGKASKRAHPALMDAPRGRRGGGKNGGERERERARREGNQTRLGEGFTSRRRQTPPPPPFARSPTRFSCPPSSARATRWLRPRGKKQRVCPKLSSPAERCPISMLVLHFQRERLDGISTLEEEREKLSMEKRREEIFWHNFHAIDHPRAEYIGLKTRRLRRRVLGRRLRLPLSESLLFFAPICQISR